MSGSSPGTCSSSARTTTGSRRSRSPSSSKARGIAAMSGAYAASSASRAAPATAGGAPGRSSSPSAASNAVERLRRARRAPSGPAIARSDLSAGRASAIQLVCASPQRTSSIRLRIGAVWPTASSSKVASTAFRSPAVEVPSARVAAAGSPSGVSSDSNARSIEPGADSACSGAASSRGRVGSAPFTATTPLAALAAFAGVAPFTDTAPLTTF